MPNWTNLPPEDTRGKALPLIRTPQGKSLCLIATAENLIGCYTHYWGGRTLPCEAPNCKACDEGQPYRWHGYLAAWNPNLNKQYIFEFTNQAAEEFVLYREHHGTLRGCNFIARRMGSSANAKVEIRTKPADLNVIQLPPEPNVIRAMSMIWGLPIDAIDDNNFRNQSKEIRMKTEPLAKMRGEPKPKNSK